MQSHHCDWKGGGSHFNYHRQAKRHNQPVEGPLHRPSLHPSQQLLMLVFFMEPVYNVRACHRVGDLSMGISLALCASAHNGGIDAWCVCTGRANESCSCLCVHVNMCFVSTFKLIQMRSDQLGCSASSTVTSLCFTKHQILLPATQGCFE